MPSELQGTGGKSGTMRLRPFQMVSSSIRHECDEHTTMTWRRWRPSRYYVHGCSDYVALQHTYLIWVRGVNKRFVQGIGLGDRLCALRIVLECLFAVSGPLDRPASCSYAHSNTRTHTYDLAITCAPAGCASAGRDNRRRCDRCAGSACRPPTDRRRRRRRRRCRSAAPRPW